MAPEASGGPSAQGRPARRGVVLHQPLAGGGVRDPEIGQKPPKWGFTHKKAKFGQNSQKWLFFDDFPENCPVATGLKLVKMAKIGQNPQNGLKVRFCGSREFPRGWFYINPSRRGPVPVPGPGTSSSRRHVAESLQAAPGLEGASMVLVIKY